MNVALAFSGSASTPLRQLRIAQAALRIAQAADVSRSLDFESFAMSEESIAHEDQ